jgi:lactobin A/cerein 7B family class IIb bacteriocin
MNRKQSSAKPIKQPAKKSVEIKQGLTDQELQQVVGGAINFNSAITSLNSATSLVKTA